MTFKQCGLKLRLCLSIGTKSRNTVHAKTVESFLKEVDARVSLKLMDDADDMVRYRVPPSYYFGEYYNDGQVVAEENNGEGGSS